MGNKIAPEYKLSAATNKYIHCLKLLQDLQEFYIEALQEEYDQERGEEIYLKSTAKFEAVEEEIKAHFTGNVIYNLNSKKTENTI